jgi:hypothetical protein
MFDYKIAKSPSVRLMVLVSGRTQILIADGVYRLGLV